MSHHHYTTIIPLILLGTLAHRVEALIFALRNGKSTSNVGKTSNMTLCMFKFEREIKINVSTSDHVRLPAEFKHIT